MTVRKEWAVATNLWPVGYRVERRYRWRRHAEWVARNWGPRTWAVPMDEVRKAAARPKRQAINEMKSYGRMLLDRDRAAL